MNKRHVILYGALLCLGLLPCCQWLNKGSGPLKTGGAATDITEDLHHRMMSGVMNLQKEPLIVSVPNPENRARDVPNAYIRVSWELGTFWVKANDNGLLVTHWNTDVIYGHVTVTGSNAGKGTRRYFLEYPHHPVKIKHF